MRAREVPALPLVAAAITFLVHLIANPHYGFFRDELYFIICGRHPQFGYVDQPPVVPLLSALTQIFGPSLVALRALPALCAAACVFITIRLAEELDGDTFAQIVAAISVFFALVLMSFGMKVSPDMIGLWAWPLIVLYVVRLIKGADPRWWLAAGALLGLCLQSKYSVLFFIVALIAGLVLSAQRRTLLTPWFAGGMLLAALIALPNLLWQAHYDFPMWELLQNGQHGKNIILSPFAFLAQQLLLTNPLLSLVWIAGLIYCLRAGTLRWLAYTWILLMALMIAAHGKAYYPADIYPPIFAAGAVAISRWVENAPGRVAILSAAVLAGVLFTPVILPVLPEQTFLSYSRALQNGLHISEPQTEHGRTSPLSADFADMHGWPELAQKVARVYDSLPPEQRSVAVIAASNYGEAAAIDFFGAQYRLPPVVSGHNQYYLWGTHGYSGDVLIDVGGDCGKSANLFRSSQLAATFSAPYVISYEDHLPIMLCRGIKKPLTEVWPAVKQYI